MTTSARKPRSCASAASSNCTPDAGLAEQQPERQVHQQRGQPEPGGQPDGGDRRDDHGRAHEQRHRHAVAAHRLILGRAGYDGRVTAFEDLAARIDYPMYVVTTSDGDTRAGCLVGFTTQCSIDPVRFLVCLSDKNHTYRVALHASTVAVHLLRESQRDVAALFGGETGDEVDKLARCAWTPGPDGVPVLDGCAAWFAGRVVDRFVLGDHTGLLLEPFDGSAGDSGGYVSFADVRDLTPGHEA